MASAPRMGLLGLILAHGATDGQDVEDWLRAEGELRAAQSGAGT